MQNVNQIEKRLKKNALIVFLKYPVPGKVKTRLIPAIGKRGALSIYRKLLGHTLSLTQELLNETQIFLFFGGDVDTIGMPSPYNTTEYKIFPQQGDHLGQRMRHAFEKTFSEGCEKVCIIGSDCPQLLDTHIKQAYTMLDICEVVAGPARDGGYYLIGLKNPDHLFVFDFPDWSHEQVLQRTLKLIRNKALSYGLLEELRDTDTPEDYFAFKEKLDDLKEFEFTDEPS
ncbi:MAG: TIGR04282 family arsenosugar biosynthesis glycosyltransferase [Balneolales bacterium]|nr:TIGR04282 family arsenosugar biosynthesis glycosyltransferase [Balneolales bacterium]